MTSRKKSPPNGESLRLARRLIAENLRGNAAKFALAVSCLLVVAVSTASVAWLMREMINGIYVERDFQAVWVVSAAVMTAYMAKGAAAYLGSVTLGAVGAAIVASMQRRQFQTLMTFGMGYFSGAHPSTFMTRLQHGARAARSVVVLVTTNFFRDLFTLLGLGLVMFLQDPGMSLLVLAASPLAVWGVWWIVRRTRQVATREDEVTAAVTSVGTEAIEGLRVIKSFSMESAVNHRVGRSVEQMERRTNAIQRVTSLTSPLMETIGGLIIGMFVIYAGWQTLTNDKTPGEFMAFITSFLLAYEPAKRLANFNVQFQRQMVAVKRMYELLDKGVPEEAEAPGDIEPFRISSGHIKIEKLSFAYRKGRPVLRNVSFEVRPGEKVALVGRSGAGKSTIVNLILQMYRHSSGSILIDGRDIREMSLADLRAGIAYVTQDTFLFSGTVRDNILFGRPDATDEEIREAAEAANALPFIESLPDGLDSEVGENGGKLSGGQRQRLAIARALIKNAPVLLFDEATSSLDGEAERAVKNAESRLMQGRTAIIIAHRLSTIREADRIVVLDAGRVVAIGRHEDLIARNETYRALFLDPKAEP